MSDMTDCCCICCICAACFSLCGRCCLYLPCRGKFQTKKEDEEFAAEVEREAALYDGGPPRYEPSYPMHTTQQPQEARVSYFNDHQPSMRPEPSTFALHFPRQLDTPQTPAHAATR